MESYWLLLGSLYRLGLASDPEMCSYMTFLATSNVLSFLQEGKAYFVLR